MLPLRGGGGSLPYGARAALDGGYSGGTGSPVNIQNRYCKGQRGQASPVPLREFSSISPSKAFMQRKKNSVSIQSDMQFWPGIVKDTHQYTQSTTHHSIFAKPDLSPFHQSV
jgi:hypothetical protein